MTIFDTFLIDGVDICNLARIAEAWDGAMTNGARRGSNLVVPGRAGEVFMVKTRDVPTLALGLVILAVDPDTGAVPSSEAARVAQGNANVRALARLVNARTDRPLTLTRRLSLPGGNQTHEALGELAQPFNPSGIGAAQGWRLVLELRVLDGVWHGQADQAATVTGTGVVHCGGDTTTTRIFATFSQAATLANATLGASLTVSEACTVDVDALTADTALLYGRFGLVAGDNTVTVTAGTVGLSWREAYL